MSAFAARIQRLETGSERSLVLRCRMANGLDYPVTGVEVNATVAARVGKQLVRLADGLRGHVGRGEPPSKYFYPPKTAFELILIVPLSSEAIAEIESARSDDVAISIMGDVVYSIAHQQGPNAGHWYMGERRWDVLTDGGRPDAIQCPQSDWLKHLARLKWQDYQILEIPRATTGDSRFARAYEQLRKASTQYSSRHWDTCAFHCRKAYEAAMKDASKIDDMKAAADDVLSKHTGLKRERLNDLLMALGAYTQLARHEKGEPVVFDKPDAAQVLFMTTAAVDYIAQQ